MLVSIFFHLFAGGVVFRGADFRKKYTVGPRYWDIPVLVNTGTFLVY